MSFQRERILNCLISFSESLVDVKEMVGSLSWDYNGPPVIFKKSHLIDVLDRYACNRFSAEEVECWANLIECREDIDYEEAYSEKLAEAIYQLANPVLEGPLTSKKIQSIIDSLKSTED